MVRGGDAPGRVETAIEAPGQLLDVGPQAAPGVRVVRLETNRTLTEAISLYRAAGYREVPAFNDEPYAHHWFEKTI